AGMVGPRLVGVDGRTQVSYRPRPSMTTLLSRTFLLRWLGLGRAAYHHYRRNTFDPRTTRAVDVLMGAPGLMPRQCFHAVGRWGEDFAFGGEDLELAWRVNQRAAAIFLPDAQIIHYGRVSTRQHVRFSSPQIAIGFLQYLRKTGASRLGLWLYKLAVTLDAPVQCLVKGMQYLVRRWRGKRRKAEQSLLAAQAAGHFLTRGLFAFWRA